VPCLATCIYSVTSSPNFKREIDIETGWEVEEGGYGEGMKDIDDCHQSISVVHDRWMAARS
jgi:hypothetical protein